ncbi:HlyD family type I secretion periplasmic adaptor subunit [Acidicapsa acidisoli]|uniref:HlyD family type I secretion periplasmic adaptor subunit n=1 Tax=Acidicapsa acidisoli TaxID=1615681 RepID=UPI0021E0BC36|nr:HlyD family type I secretion periplasmic adaptor subunit [Acidicapsa acidisoli]
MSLRQRALRAWDYYQEANEYIQRKSDKLWRRIEPYLDKPDPETEFLPAALEIIETPASPAGRIIAGTLIVFFVIALLWACIGSVDIIATAQGKIVPTGRSKVIQPFETGVVHAIHVQDGQSVKAGDVLIEIDATISEAERDRLQKEYMTAALDVARLKASLSTADDPATDFIAPEEATEDQIALQKSLLTSQVAEQRAKLAGLDRQIAQYGGNLAAVQSNISKITEALPYLEKKARARQSLADRQIGSKMDAYSAQQDLVEHQQELKVQRGRLDEATAQVSSFKEQREQAEAEYKHKNLDDLTQAAQKASSLHEQFIEASKKYRLQTLTSPVDGTVQQLAVHTEGGVVTPAQTLMVVVPGDSRLEIEAMVPNRDIGFVHEGQEVAVKIDTFNYTRYGLLHGRVISVSQDAITRDKPADKTDNKQQAGSEDDSSEPKGQELVYSARISLDRSEMQIDDRMINLEPGMAATAEIKTGSRHIISYLLSPLSRAGHEAITER